MTKPAARRRGEPGPGTKGERGARAAAGAGAAPRATREWPTSLVLASYVAPILLLFGGFLFSNAMLYGSDMIPMGYMARKLYRVMWSTYGEFPLWNPYILGGLPFVDALHGDIFYPTTILKFLFPLHRGIGIVLVLHVYLAGVFMYACLRGEGLSKAAAWFGGLAYMAGPYFVSLFLAGHDAKIYVTTLFPLAFLLLRRAERDATLRAYAAFGLVVGLLILTSHIQMAYFALWALGLQFLTHLYAVRAERGRAARAALLFAGALLLGVAVGAVQLYPSYVYTSRFGPRAGGLGYATSTSWSLHPEEIVSLWVPEFVAYLDGYWGRNPFKLNCESPGVIPVLLALVFLLFAKGERRRFFGFLLVGALVYALGANTPVFRLFYAVLPGVKLFRAPSIIAFLAHFTVAFLAAHALERWAVRRAAAPVEAKRALLLLGALAAALVVLLALGGGLLGAWRALDPALTPEKTRAFFANVSNLRTGALLGLGAIALVAWATRAALAGRLAAPTAAILLGAATLLLDWRVDRDFIRAEPLERYIHSDPAIEFLRARPGGPFRVLSATGRYPANYLPIFEIESPQGFHDNRVRTFDELIMKDQSVLGRPAFMDLLNVRYVVAEGPFGGLPVVFRDGAVHVLENPTVLPRASLHRRAEVVANEEALARMKAPGWDPRAGVLLEQDPGVALDPAADAADDRVEIARYTPNRITISVTAAAPALLLVTNNYLPYWRASVDGAGAPLLRADYTFQAVPVPAGTHEVALTFRSPPFARALGATALGLAAVGLALAFGGARPARPPA
jgi:hypothetical protein